MPASRVFARFASTRSGSQRGEFYPPFLYISITNSCNLRCQGCWVDVAAKQEKIEAAAMHRLINESREMGNAFFGIVGGEPFMHPELLDILAEHPDCYFQIFTNGHFITPEIAQRIRQLGNISPLISVEGQRDRQRPAARQGAGLQPHHAGPAELPRRQRHHRASAPASARPTWIC